MSLRLVQSVTCVPKRLATSNVQSCLKQCSASSHTLTVPYHHEPLVTLNKQGIPEKAVRQLTPSETRWDFWTSSESFVPVKPRFLGFRYIPYGQTWVVERFGTPRSCEHGVHFLIPGIDKIKAVKSAHPITMGVISNDVKTADGTLVNAYAVVYLSILDPVKSAYYVDSETQKTDSERAVVQLVRKTLNEHISTMKLSSTQGELSASDISTLKSKVMDVLRQKSAALQVKVNDMEIRGAFPSSMKVSHLLRAMDPPERPTNAVGHGLSPNYWEDALTPPFFDKRKFGSLRTRKTPVAVTLEWSIPSPPDFHHFNEPPRMTAALPADKSTEQITAKHH